MTISEYFEKTGTDLETVEIKTEMVGPGLHVLFGEGGSWIVSDGGLDGVILFCEAIQSSCWTVPTPV